jgi:serine/threonine-protein kinase HipA
MNELAIWVGPLLAARLKNGGEGFELVYTDEWLQSGGYAFSPHLPLGCVTRGAAVRHFFSNLLPEGHALESMASAHQVSKFDVFGMMRKAGRDCAGALVLIDPGEAPEVADAGYLAMSDGELNQRISDARLHDVPLMFWKSKRRMSLAGVQNKLGVYMSQDSVLHLPEDAAPTSHILKVGDQKHEGIAANEHFCLRLAHALGLTVPESEFRRLPEPVLLVQRYDRLWTPDGDLVRTHQIDGCQALNLPPDQKYEEPPYEHSPGGATLADIVKLSSLCNASAAAKVELLRWVLFNYLIGNTDAHAKNLSLLVQPTVMNGSMAVPRRGIEVAPFYDLVCGTVYGYKDFAQHIGQETQIDFVTGVDWAAFAKSCEVPLPLLKLLAKDLTARLSRSLPHVVSVLALKTADPVVTRVGDEVVRHAKFLQESLIHK